MVPENNYKLSTMIDPIMSIGTLADRVGLSVSAIRKYENEGLIISYRRPTGRRLFSLEDIDRVKMIKHLINNVGLNMEGIRRLQALIPCWELLSCDPAEREKCPAYEDTTKPCWMIKDNLCSEVVRKTCRTCPIYRFGSQCTEDIKSLVHRHSKSEQTSQAMKQLKKMQDH
ncbi:MerR family transcriptional regulator [candidate division CSSED10-310 bacterium]|uniref:MerR family transcriptional regulator n=1 Tax=candidate division CSSED10-310 bacterium TaxID=2855610 RepID=A0ABV6YXM4_UNCC1